MINRKFDLIVDTTSCLTKEWFEKNDVIPLPHGIADGDREIWDDFGVTLPIEELYARMRDGESFSTMQGSYDKQLMVYEEHGKAGRDLLYIGFSSGLTGTFGVANSIAAQVTAAHPGMRIICFDTRCAAIGQGIVAMEAVRLADAGLDIMEAAAELEALRYRVNHYFMVDDLNHLFRGGRLSKTSAFVGTLMGVRPILSVNREGKLVSIGKVRGKQNAVNELVRLAKSQRDSATDRFYVSHGDCYNDASALAAQLKNATGLDSEIMFLGSTISVHAGPGTLVVIFRGADREGN